MTYKDLYLTCKTPEEMRATAERDARLAMSITGVDRSRRVMEAYREALKEKGWKEVRECSH